MSPELSLFAPLLLVAPLLVAMALIDLRHLMISNRLVLAMLTIFALSAPVFLSLPEIGHRALAGFVVFAFGVTGYAFRLWGGGDVKATAVLVLFVPSHLLSVYALGFSVSMALGIALVLSARALFGQPDSAWTALRPASGIPMGVAIALSGLGLPVTSLMISI